MAVAASGFSFAYWKRTQPNHRIAAPVTFAIDEDDVPGQLYDDSKNLIVSGEAIGYKPEIQIATLSSFSVPVEIRNTLGPIKNSGFTYTLEIMNNDTPDDIYLTAGSGTFPTSETGVISGSFLDNTLDTPSFNVVLKPDNFLCKFEEDARVVASIQPLKTGVGTYTEYSFQRIRTLVCKKTSNEFISELQWPDGVMGADGDNISVIRITRHFTACFNTYRNVIVETTYPARPPSSLQILTYVPPTIPSNLENIMGAVIPIKMKRTIELYYPGSGEFGNDVVKFNLIVKPAALQVVEVS